MAVLERPGEEHTFGRHRLELASVVAEADDHRPRVDARERLEQHVDALVEQQLPEVDDRRLLSGEELGEALGVPLVREPLVRIARIGRIAARLGDQRSESVLVRLRPPRVHVDAGRYLVDALDVAADLLDDLADVRRADERRRRRGEHVPSPRLELRAAAHRVLELRAVRLDRVRSPRRPADRAAEQHVVAEAGSRRGATPARPRRSPRPRRRAPPASSPAGAGPDSPRSGRGRTSGAARRRRDGRPAHRRRRSCSGWVSWQRTVTSCPARAHSRASWRV